jgi:hypothetical protein
MTERELLYQMLSREVNNILGGINPAFRMFSDMATNYIINIIDPYVSAFISNGNNLNSKAASSFVKQEINDKVDAFMKKFEEETAKNEL